MKHFRFALASALLVGLPAVASAASQPIRFLPGQTVYACPKKPGPPVQPGVVCTEKIAVGGGAPVSGYTFTVKSGTTLPPGVFLVANTGVITATSANPPLPKAGKRLIHLVASDGSKIGNGVVTLEMQTGTCGCAVFQSAGGFLPAARLNQPYAVALPVSGPPSNQVLRPNYSWSLGAGVLPPGMTLDKARGVLRGTPTDGAGHTAVFTVNITERHTGDQADVLGQYGLPIQ